MVLLQDELARFEAGQLTLAAMPLRVRWQFAALPTADGHSLDCTLECSVRAVDDPTERRMLNEVLLRGRSRLRVADVAEHFAAPLRSAAAAIAQAREAHECLAESGRHALAEGMRKAAAPVAFSCGLEMLPPFVAQTASPTLERQQLAQRQRQLAEQQASGQLAHFARSAELLKQFEALRQSAPDLSPGRLLDQMSPADRGSTLQTLLLASAQHAPAQQLWAVAGPYLVKVDVRTQPMRAELRPLPPTLGPLRSVQATADGKLMVGAQGGFFVLDPQSPAEPLAFAIPGLESPLGFNAVAAWADGGFVASHGQAGLVKWNPGQPDRPAATLPLADLASPGGPASSPRNLMVWSESQVLVSVGSRLIVTDFSHITPLPSASTAEVVGVVPDGDVFIAIHQDGAIGFFDRASRQLVRQERHGGRISAAAPLPWLGSQRLLLASEHGPISCVGPDDPLVSQYASVHADIKVLAAAADRVVALTSDRQRLIAWNSWDGRAPVGELHVVSLTRNRVADIAFA